MTIESGQWTECRYWPILPNIESTEHLEHQILPILVMISSRPSTVLLFDVDDTRPAVSYFLLRTRTANYGCEKPKNGTVAWWLVILGLYCTNGVNRIRRNSDNPASAQDGAPTP
jgi:hypothetical protein